MGDINLIKTDELRIELASAADKSIDMNLDGIQVVITNHDEESVPHVVLSVGGKRLGLDLPEGSVQDLGQYYQELHGWEALEHSLGKIER